MERRGIEPRAILPLSIVDAELSMKTRRILFPGILVALAAIAAGAPRTFPQNDVPRLDYQVEVADIGAKLFGVTCTVSNVHSPAVDLAMAAWTPGWYVIADHARHVRKFRAKTLANTPLRAERLDKQTWRVYAEGEPAFKVTYEVYANRLHVNGAEIRSDHAYFIGTTLFLYVPGHTSDSPSTVSFKIPDQWQVATALPPSEQKGIYRAADFDSLVDAPTILGFFDEGSFHVAGHTIHTVFDPKGAFTPAMRDQVAERLQKVLAQEVEVFGEVPFGEYWFFFLFGLRDRGGLEHENSSNLVLSRSAIRAPETLAPLGAHEFFHLWNAKRIRPAALMQYDYRKEQYVRELWFTEGVTDYYSALSSCRAGLVSKDDFLNKLSRTISFHKNNDARLWISAEQASFTTWLGYEDRLPFSVDYYSKGQLLGLLLDLEIRAATKNTKSLDDVMRSLYFDFYKKGKGFTDPALEALISRMAGRGFKDFFAKYVSGVDELPYNEALRRAGYQLDLTETREPVLGVQTMYDGDQVRVTGVMESSSAAEAGVQPGDTLVSVGSVIASRRHNLAEGFRNMYQNKEGEMLQIKVLRRGREMILSAPVRYRVTSSGEIVELANPTAEQLQVRNAWLSGQK